MSRAPRQRVDTSQKGATTQAGTPGLWFGTRVHPRVECRVFKPSLLYFALTFAVGFVLGSIRINVLTPRVGPVVAVLIECPLILLASFLIARWVLARHAPTANALRRLAIGGVAFAMLIAAEMALSAASGIWPRAFVDSLLTPARAIGLGGQMLFAVLPVLIRPRANAAT